ncbi:hypothetical protein [Pseudomonas sp. S2_A02]
MPTGNKPAEPQASVATGADLEAATWTDFVQRLRHDCVGAGVRDHCTANAIFIVQAKRIIYGIDTDYSDNRVLIDHCNEGEWFSPEEFWADQDHDERTALNKAMQAWSSCQFMKADESDQWYVLGDLEGHSITGWQETWEYVNAHFTKDAAEAFIRRKKHDYRKGMRVYVDSQYYAWEFNAIKEAILDGTLTYTPKVSA